VLPSVAGRLGADFNIDVRVARKAR